MLCHERVGSWMVPKVDSSFCLMGCVVLYASNILLDNLDKII